MYQLGIIDKVIPQIRNGKSIVRRAKVTILKKDENMGKIKLFTSSKISPALLLSRIAKEWRAPNQNNCKQLAQL